MSAMIEQWNDEGRVWSVVSFFSPFLLEVLIFLCCGSKLKLRWIEALRWANNQIYFIALQTLHWWPLDRGWIVRIRLTPVISPAACRPALMGTSTRCKELFRCSSTVFQYMNGPFLLISRSNARCLVWAKFYWIAQMDGLIARARSGRAALNIQILLHLWSIGNMAFQRIARWENTYY